MRGIRHLCRLAASLSRRAVPGYMHAVSVGGFGAAAARLMPRAHLHGCTANPPLLDQHPWRATVGACVLFMGRGQVDVARSSNVALIRKLVAVAGMPTNHWHSKVRACVSIRCGCFSVFGAAVPRPQ